MDNDVEMRDKQDDDDWNHEMNFKISVTTFDKESMIDKDKMDVEQDTDEDENSRFIVEDLNEYNKRVIPHYEDEIEDEDLQVKIFNDKPKYNIKEIPAFSEYVTQLSQDNSSTTQRSFSECYPGLGEEDDDEEYIEITTGIDKIYDKEHRENYKREKRKIYLKEIREIRVINKLNKKNAKEREIKIDNINKFKPNMFV